MIERDEKGDTILGGRVDSFLYGIVEWADISFEVNKKTRIMIKSGEKIKLMIIKIGWTENRRAKIGLLEIYTCFDQRKKWKWMKWKKIQWNSRIRRITKISFLSVPYSWIIKKWSYYVDKVILLYIIINI